VNDSAYDLDSVLQGIFARRIGKLTNNEFTLGASGGPAGVIPSLNVGVTAASATAVTLAELNALPASIDYGYRQPEANPVWSFSPGVEKLLKSMTGTVGLRLFPEMEDGELLGYPYVVNVDMASAFAINAKAIAFGSFKKGVTIRQVTPILTVSKERFAEYFQTYYSMIHRQDCVVSDVNALAVLQMAAS
jgi:HK97 family phage major capsid protein